MSGGEDDDDAGGEDRFPRRGRVTLKWAAEPLLLPGEEHAGTGRLDDRDQDTAELTLPPPGPAPLPRPPSIPPPGESPEGRDGWERHHRSLTPAPMKAAHAGHDLGDDDGGALSLIDKRSRPSSPTIDLSTEMHDRFALGDYTAALRIAELVLGRLPEDDAARRVSASCRERLGQLHGSRLGAPSRVPHVAIELADVRWLGLDHRAGFLLSQVDGEHSLEELIDICGMSRLEALRTFVELLDVGAIGFED